MPARLLSPLRSPFAPGRRVFNPATLFAGGQAGFYFDPLDPTTAYQDSAGTTAGVVAQPVGLRLDKRLGAVRGAELVAGGDMSTPAAWTDASSVGGTGVVSGGVGTVTNTTANGRLRQQLIGNASAASYEVTFDITALTAANLTFTVGSTAGGTDYLSTGISTTGAKRFIFRANSSAIHLSFVEAAVGAASFDNVSCRELPGNHSTQSTSPSRPVWAQDASGFYRDTFDGFDDSLTIAAGGGSTTGFFYCAAINVAGGAGTTRRMWSDQNGQGGIIVGLSTTNAAQIAASNGTTFTTLFAPANSTPVGQTCLVTAWDDGVNLNVQVGSGQLNQVARPAIVAGTASITEGKDNGAASGFLPGSLYARVYRAGPPPSAAQIAQVQRFIASRAGVTL